jgi:hypothetical protein
LVDFCHWDFAALWRKDDVLCRKGEEMAYFAKGTKLRLKHIEIEGSPLMASGSSCAVKR